MSADSASYPFAEDLDGIWHRRPEGDEWRPFRDGYEGPQCRTMCGTGINSVHVSDSLPDAETYGPDLKLCECASAEPAS